MVRRRHAFTDTEAQRWCTAEEAFALLKGASRRSNEKLRDVAAQMISGHEEAVRRAR